MRDRAVPAGTGPEPSPLELLPGLAELAEVMADAVAVTDLHRRVVVWNGAAARLYGIPADQAIGVPIDALYASRIVGEAVSSAGARTLALEFGSWRGRVADRPLVGGATDRELVLDVVLSRLDDRAGGRPAS